MFGAASFFLDSAGTNSPALREWLPLAGTDAWSVPPICHYIMRLAAGVNERPRFQWKGWGGLAQVRRVLESATGIVLVLNRIKNKQKDLTLGLTDLRGHGRLKHEPKAGRASDSCW